MLNLEKTVVFRRKGINIKKTLLGPVVCKMNLRWNQGPFIPKLHILSFNKQRKKPGLVRPPKEQTTSGKISPCGDGKPGQRQWWKRWSERRLICCIGYSSLTRGIYIYMLYKGWVPAICKEVFRNLSVLQWLMRETKITHCREQDSQKISYTAGNMRVPGKAPQALLGGHHFL